MSYLEGLTTEQPNPSSIGIDTKETAEILRIINNEDRKVPDAIGRELESIARVIDAVVDSFRRGGKLVYVGAGTSGRLGVLDAAECPPTFGTPPEMVQGIIAGGREALVRSVEWAEDKESEGAAAVDERNLTDRDVLVGITASGHAPFVIGAMKRARDIGAGVVALSCNRDSRIFQHADYRIFIDVGPEIITGSTRMKSGTAQKLVLNMITTASMIRLGKVYNNLMVDLVPVNSKLVDRSKRLIRMATGCDPETAERAFEESGRRPKRAIVMVLLGLSKDEAEQLLNENEGRIGLSVEAFKGKRRKGKSKS
ncbi:MAG TPA: N-acetylmuramic acid 6-phosphate etherase [Spirochaetia bacterium]|nr:N-acetylmuramic acid 6-phosphate etherase [Spirochaetia bacterium]